MKNSQIVKAYLVAIAAITAIIYIFTIFFVPDGDTGSLRLTVNPLVEREFITKGEQVYELQIKTRFPLLQEDKLLFLRSWHTNIIVTVDDIVYFETPQQDPTSQIVNYIVPIRNECSNKTVKIYTYSSFAYFKQWTFDLYLDSQESLVRSLLVDSAATLFLSTITVICGISLCFIALSALLKKRILGLFFTLGCFRFYLAFLPYRV